MFQFYLCSVYEKFHRSQVVKMQVDMHSTPVHNPHCCKVFTLYRCTGVGLSVTEGDTLGHSDWRFCLGPILFLE